jgi:hypothetical protein
MKPATQGVILLAFAALSACGPKPETREMAAQPPPGLEGAWHVTWISIESGPNAGSHTVDVQPAIYLFSKSHYAITAVNGFEARPYLGREPTNEENGRAFTPFTGSTGTYQSTTGALTLTEQVAKDPADMAGGKTHDFNLEWVDGKVLLIATTPETGQVRTELTRLPSDADLLPVSPESRRLKGVWRRAEMTIDAGEDKGRHVEDMQPGYYVFDPPYFAGNFVSAFAPRPLLGKKPTDADRGKAFAPFVSFAGTYTLSDNVLVFRPLVTQNPNNMRGLPFQSIKTEWAGEDVWLIYTSREGRQNRVRLARVED